MRTNQMGSMSDEFPFFSRDLEPDQMFRARELRRHSLDWLKKSWAVLRKEESKRSDVQAGVINHLARVRSYRFTPDEAINEAYKDALEFAWHAAWLCDCKPFRNNIAFCPPGNMRNGWSHFDYARHRNLFVDGPDGTQWSGIAFPKYDQNGKYIWKELSENSFQEWLDNADCNHIIADFSTGRLKLNSDVIWSYLNTSEISNNKGSIVNNSFFYGRLDASYVRQYRCCIFSEYVALKYNADAIANSKRNIFFRSLSIDVQGGGGAEFKNLAAAELSFRAEQNRGLKEVRIDSHVLRVFDSNHGATSIHIQSPNLQIVHAKGGEVKIWGSAKNLESLKISADFSSVVFQCDGNIELFQISQEGGLASSVNRVSLECDKIEDFSILSEEIGSISIKASSCEDIMLKALKIGEVELDLSSVENFVMDAKEVSAIDARAVSFNSCTLHGVDINELANFEKAKFKVACDFSAKKSIDGRHMFKAMMFRGAHFYVDSDFSNREFLGRTDFSCAIWEGVPKFFGSKLNPDTNFSEARFQIPENDSSNGVSLSDFERAFRTLKLAMEELRARHDEAKFHRFELIARRRQKGEVRWDEAILSRAYDLLSGYGQSIRKPLLWWGGGNFFVALAVWWMVHFDAERISSSVWFGFINSLRPFYTANPSFDRANLYADTTSFTYFVYELIQAGGIGFHVFTTIHSVISLIFIFLFLLALRRRFQISG